MTESNESIDNNTAATQDELAQTVDTGTGGYTDIVDDVMQYAAIQAEGQVTAMSTSMVNYGEAHGNSVLLYIAGDDRFLEGVRKESFSVLAKALKRIVIDGEPQDDDTALLINADLNHCCGKELARAYVTYCEEHDTDNLAEAKRILSLFDFDAPQGCFMVKRHIEGEYNTISGTLANGLESTTPHEVLEAFYDNGSEDGESKGE